jgi:uncharacterized membrane protein YuzA (DUF378 family)
MDEEISKLLKKRARITAILIGLAGIIAIFLLLFAVIQRQKFEQEIELLKKENESLRDKLKE